MLTIGNSRTVENPSVLLYSDTYCIGRYIEDFCLIFAFFFGAKTCSAPQLPCPPQLPLLGQTSLTVRNMAMLAAAVFDRKVLGVC